MSATRYVGVDVSKAHLDVAIRKKGGVFRRCQFPNSLSGVRSLAKVLGRKETALVVVEATGPYSVLLHEVLTEQGYRVAVVNPKRVRDLAKALGREAKTDVIDAELLVKFGEHTEPEATPLPSENLRELRACVQRRRQLSDALTAQRNQRESASRFSDADSFDEVEKVLVERMREIEKRITELCATEEPLPIVTVLLEQKGIGAIIAATILVELPELGHLTNKQIASIAGLAPHAHQSGRQEKRGYIRGGRKQLRNMLYMAALVAVRYDEDLKAFYTRLVRSGKAKKLALTAAARKILVWLNARVRDLFAINNETAAVDA